MPLKPYKKPAGRARYLLPQMNFVDPGAEAKTRRPRLPSRGLGVVSIDVDDEIRKRKKADLLRAQLTRGHSSCLLYTSPSPRDQRGSRMPSSA